MDITAVKRLVLFLFVCVFMFAMMNVVSALATGDEYTANLTVGTGTGMTLNYDGRLFNYSGTRTSVYYMPNMTNVLINITFYNYNTSMNVTLINITLPANFSYISQSSRNMSSLGPASVVESWDTATRTLTYNGSLIANVTGSFLSVAFNVSVNASEGPQVFVYNMAGINLNATNQSLLHAAYVERTMTWGLSQSLTPIVVDTIAPTISSAATYNKTHINITFSENITLRSFNYNGFNLSILSIGTNSNYTSRAVQSANPGDKLASGPSILIAAKAFPPDSTFKIVVNGTDPAKGSFLCDRANNSLANLSSTLVTDGAGPSLVSVSYNHNTKYLNLTFDENVTLVNKPTLMNISRNDALEDGDTPSSIFTGELATFAAVYSSTQINMANGSVIVLADIDARNLSRWQGTWDFNITFINQSIAYDSNTNYVVAPDKDVPGGLIGAYRVNLTARSLDTTNPTLVNVTYDTSSRNITLGFSEIINASELKLSNITIANDTNYSITYTLMKHAFNLNDSLLSGPSTGRKDAASFTFQLNSSVVDLIAFWDRYGRAAAGNRTNVTVFVVNNSKIPWARDLSGNGAYRVSNDSAVAAGSLWYRDRTAPTLALNVTVSRGTMAPGGAKWNNTGPGVINFTITFSENMSADTMPLVSLVWSDGSTQTLIGTSDTNLSRNQSSYSDHKIGTGIFHRSILIVNTTLFRNKPDGLLYLNISGAGAKDYSGNEMAAAVGNIWNTTYDKTPPYVLYAYYLENGTANGTGGTSQVNSSWAFNGSKGPGDTLVLVFSETLNNTCDNGCSFTEGNVTLFDADANADLGAGGMHYAIDGERVFIQLNGSIPMMTLRGVTTIDVINMTQYYDANDFAGLVSGSHLFKDWAGNDPTSSSNKTIGDYGFKLSNSSYHAISFPTCPNDTAMDTYMDSVFGTYEFAHYIGGNTWTLLTGSVYNLEPFKGYVFSSPNVTSRPYFIVYLQNTSDCTAREITSASENLGAGWNLIALDGFRRTHVGAEGEQNSGVAYWLSQINNANGDPDIAHITKVYNDPTATGIIGGVGDGKTYGSGVWNQLDALPYSAYWVSFSYTGNDRTLDGRGVEYWKMT